MIYKFELRTSRESLHDITATIQGAIKKSNVHEGCCLVFLSAYYSWHYY